jgi:hypothetical protein
MMKFTQKDNLSLNFTTFSAGNTALNWAKDLHYSTDPDWILSEPHDNLILAALHASGITSKSIHAGVALPFGWADKKGPALKERLTRQWEVSDGNRDMEFDLTCQIEKQGAMALLNYAFDGQEVDMSVFDNCLLIGPGGYSTEVIQAFQGQCKNISDSIKDLGMWRLTKRLIDYMDLEFDAELTIVEAKQAIKAGKTFYIDKWIDLTGWLNAEHQSLAADVLHSTRNQVVGELDNIPIKLLSGGPTPVLKPHLEQMTGGIVTTENPLFDNAIGALLRARFAAEKGQVPVGLDVGFDSTKLAFFQKTGFILGLVFPSVTGEHVKGGKI